VTASGPPERVIAVLQNAGYEVIPQPRPIGGIVFDFAAMLSGSDSLDLIALIDLAVEKDDERIRRRVEGLARALDLVRSRRSLTIILVGPGRGPGLIHAIAGVARVLTVGSPGADDDADVRDALAVLLPLDVSTEDDGAPDLWNAARGRTSREHRDEVARVITAARSGQGAVESALRDILSEPLDEFHRARGTGEEDGG
jgi:hypothetical protein